MALRAETGSKVRQTPGLGCHGLPPSSYGLRRTGRAETGSKVRQAPGLSSGTPFVVKRRERRQRRQPPTAERQPPFSGSACNRRN
jgi:hypothetical protein